MIPEILFLKKKILILKSQIIPMRKNSFRRDAKAQTDPIQGGKIV